MPLDTEVECWRGLRGKTNGERGLEDGDPLPGGRPAAAAGGGGGAN